jgi:hypothetical protein
MGLSHCGNKNRKHAKYVENSFHLSAPLVRPSAPLVRLGHRLSLLGEAWVALFISYGNGHTGPDLGWLQTVANDVGWYWILPVLVGKTSSPGGH